MFHISRTKYLTAISMLALAACGGSGGGSPAPAPTPPPPPAGGGSTNAAPTVSITVSEMTPLEGESSLLDGSGSADADGDSLTFSWTQLSGPSVTFTAPTAEMTEISVPNLAADTPARIQLSVSDGTATTSSEVTLTLTNIVLTPAASSTITNERIFNDNNNVTSIVASDNFGDTLSYLVYERDGEDLLDLFGYDENNNPAILTSEAIEADSSNLTADGTPNPSFIPWLAAFEDDEVTLFAPLAEPAEQFSIDVDAPCSLARENNRAFENTFIGSRTGDSSLIEYVLNENFTATGETVELASFGEGQALCEMQIVARSLNGTMNGFAPGIADGERLLAFDENANRIISYTLPRDENNRVIDAVESSSVAIDLDLPEGVTADFVASKKISASGQDGLALVFSDGQTEGQHRLVIIGSNGDGTISQDLFRWDFGTPTSIVSAPIDGHGGETLFITTSDSPYAVIFQSGEVFSSDTTYLPLSGPTFFDVGVGHGVASNFTSGPERQRGTIVTFPDENLIRIFERD